LKASSTARAAAVRPPLEQARGLRLALIVLAGVLVYWNTLSNPLIFDDHPTIVANPQIREWWNLPQVFAAEQGSPVAGRPLVSWTLAINYALGGLEPTGFHIGNIAIHIGCGLLIFALVRRTLLRPELMVRFAGAEANIAFAAALLWTLHPLNTEVVDYTSQRTEGLMALFYLLTIYACIRALEPARTGAWIVAAVVCSALGMACKEPMATVPLMVVLYDRVFVFDSFASVWRARWRLYSGLAATWIVLAILYWSGPRELSGGYASTQVSWWTYLLNQTVIVSHYLRLAVWPRGLSAGYGWTPPVTLGDVWPYALWISGLFVATLLALWRAPRIGWLGAWFFVTLAPSSSFLPVAAEVGAERRMYLPLMGLVVLTVVGLAALWGRLFRAATAGPARARRLSVAAAVVLFVVGGALATETFARNAEYASEDTLARTMLERWPSGFAHHAVAVILSKAGDHEGALAHLRAAVPTYPPARYQLGLELFRLNRFDEAIAELRTFLQEEPGLAEIGAAHAIIGRALTALRRPQEAIAEFRLAIAAPTPDVTAHGRLAEILFQQQAYDEAITEYRAFLNAYPNDQSALGGLGVALIVMGHADEAIAAFRRAVTLDPQNGLARENLARALLDTADVAGGATEAERAVALRPNSPAAHDLLGRALAAEHRVPEARREFERALALDPSFTDARDHLRALLR
jgi:tetratricopeptide (TPR) repeat protein